MAGLHSAILKASITFWLLNICFSARIKASNEFEVFTISKIEDEQQIGGCELAGLKSNSELEVIYPVPEKGTSPFSDKEEDKYEFTSLGSFASGEYYFLRPPKRANEHTWIFSAAVPLTVYINLFASETLPDAFNGWGRSQKRGTRVRYSRRIGSKRFSLKIKDNTYGPGIVVARTFPAGQEVVIESPEKWKDQMFFFVKPECATSDICKHGGWAVQKQLGNGAQGRILEVARISPGGIVDASKTYALKIPLNPNDHQAAQAIAAERQIMVDATSCENTLDVVDAAPCVLEPTGHLSFRAHAYVMPKLKGNLDSWLAPASPAQKSACFADIQQQITAGLQCLHEEAKYIHGDFKTDNVMYIDEDGGCPRGVQLIDFGFSARTETPVQLIPGQGYLAAHHMVGARFMSDAMPLRATPAGQVDPLQISHGPRHFLAKPEVDWCSYLLIMRMWYGPDMKVVGLDSLDCGMMGPNRATHVTGSGNIDVAGGWPPQANLGVQFPPLIGVGLPRAPTMPAQVQRAPMRTSVALPRAVLRPRITYRLVPGVPAFPMHRFH